MPETRQVLMQRVIALNGAPESPASTAKTPDIDLTRTVHEWGVENRVAGSSASPATVRGQEPAQNVKGPADEQWATYSSISLEICGDTQLTRHPLNASVEDAVTQQFNPASTPSAVPLATSIGDLASLDRALESAGVREARELGAITNFRQPSTHEPIQPEAPSAPQAAPSQRQPRMILVPASIVWAVVTVFSVCALALTFLVIAYIVRSQFSLF